MPVLISLLRGINVGGHHKIPMAEVRKIYESLGAESVQTYVQSGNVVFRGPDKLAGKISDAVEKQFGFRIEVMQRTVPEWRNVIERNPFPGVEGNRLAVAFFQGTPDPRSLDGLNTAPEQIILSGRELFTYYPNGMARPTIPMARIEKLLRMPGTARNWNTVLKLMDLAAQIASEPGTPSKL